jgi:dihydrofolate reductase
MGRLILQMMISADGMVSGPKGELDWIAHDKEIEQDHLNRVEHAEAMIIGAGLYPDMPHFWRNAATDENADAFSRGTGRAMNKLKMVVYSHKDMPADQPGDEVHVVTTDAAFLEDIQRLKKEIKGTIITYGGVRFARSLLQYDLVDELHLDVCPVILGEGQSLFTDLAHRTQLRLMKTTPYKSGATEMHYEVVKD